MGMALRHAAANGCQADSAQATEKFQVSFRSPDTTLETLERPDHATIDVRAAAYVAGTPATTNVRAGSAYEAVRGANEGRAMWKLTLLWNPFLWKVPRASTVGDFRGKGAAHGHRRAVCSGIVQVTV